MVEERQDKVRERIRERSDGWTEVRVKIMDEE